MGGEGEISFSEKDVRFITREARQQQVQLQLRRRGVRSSRDRVYIASFRMGEEVGESGR